MLFNQRQFVFGRQRFLRQARRVCLEAADNRIIEVGDGGSCFRGRGRRNSGGALLFSGKRGFRAEALDIRRARLVLAVEHAERRDRVHDFLLIRVDDRQRQALVQRANQERLRHQQAIRQAERNVRHAEHGLQPHVAVHRADGGERLLRLILLGGNGQRQAVDEHVLAGDAEAFRRIHNAPCDCDALRRRLGQALLVQRQTDDRRAVFLHHRQQRLQRFLFAVDGVDRRFAIIDAQGGFQRGGVGGIQLERHIHRFLQFLNHAREHGDFIHARIADVDIQNLRARVHLRNGDIDDVIQIARQ